jgi:hypothetical protein
MRKNIFIILISLFFAFTVSSCSKDNDKAAEPKKRPDDAFSEYVNTGKKTLDKSKELSRQADEKNKEMEKMLDDM